MQISSGGIGNGLYQEQMGVLEEPHQSLCLEEPSFGTKICCVDVQHEGTGATCLDVAN